MIKAYKNESKMEFGGCVRRSCKIYESKELAKQIAFGRR